MEATYFESYADALNAAVNARKPRSAWDKGVAIYVEELIEQLRENIDGGFVDVPRPQDMENVLLNGAHDWRQYSDGGCSLVWDCDIARRVCTAAELRRTHNGERNPNPRENWLQCQARALSQAARKIVDAAYHVAASETGDYVYQK